MLELEVAGTTGKERMGKEQMTLFLWSARQSLDFLGSVKAHNRVFQLQSFIRGVRQNRTLLSQEALVQVSSSCWESFILNPSSQAGG